MVFVSWSLETSYSAVDFDLVLGLIEKLLRSNLLFGSSGDGASLVDAGCFWNCCKSSTPKEASNILAKFKTAVCKGADSKSSTKFLFVTWLFSLQHSGQKAFDFVSTLSKALEVFVLMCRSMLENHENLENFFFCYPRTL